MTVGRHKVVSNVMRPNDIKSGCFEFQMSQSVTKSMPSLTSKSYSDSVLAVWFSSGPFVCRSSKHLQVSDMPKKKPH